MIKTIFILFFLIILTSCHSLKKVVFSKSNFTTIQNRGIVRDNLSGLVLDLQQLEMRYGGLPDSANLITNSVKLFECQNIAKYAKSIFNDLKITNADTILFFIAGEILVYKPSNFNPKEADYQYILNDTINNEYFTIAPDKLSKEICGNCIYRKLIFNKKRKRIIIIDTYKDNKNNWLSTSYLIETETKYNSKILPRVWTTKYIDLSKPEHLLFIANYIKEFDLTTKINKQNLSLSSKYAFDIFSDFFKKGKYYNYYSAYLGENLSGYYFQPQSKGVFLQALATYFSFADDTNKSDSVWLLIRNNKINNKQIEKTGTINDLLQLTKNQKVVMINEAHNAPKHRLFVSNMLDTFYNQGFRYLALEAFYTDSIFEKTGYLTENNGFYIFEPTFANLIRKAYKKGFKIIGYDDFSSNREQKQAENIYNQTINIDNNAKVLVYCGYQHIDTAKMAGEFRRLSGITPLTIEQTYSYYYCLGKYATNTIFLIKPNNEDFYYKSANVFLFNDLVADESNTTIQIPNKIAEICKMVCVYEKNEFEYLTKIGMKPLPIAVQNAENKSFVKVNLDKNNSYYVLFLNKLGEVIEYTTLAKE